MKHGQKSLILGSLASALIVGGFISTAQADDAATTDNAQVTPSIPAAGSPTQKETKTEIAIQRMTGSLVEFLSGAIYPDSPDLGKVEQQLLNPPAEKEETTNANYPENQKKKVKPVSVEKANNQLLVSSLAGLASNPNAAILTKNGFLTNQGTDYAASLYSKRNMQSFLCDQGTQGTDPNCLFNPKHSNPLIQTLSGLSFASKNGGLFAADSLFTPKLAENAEKKQQNFSSTAFTGGNTNAQPGNLDRTPYFDYDYVLRGHEPDSLMPAKYYGLFLTGAYDLKQDTATIGLKKKMQEALASGKRNDMYQLQIDPSYQRYVLTTRKIAATNSALMSNVLSMAKRQTIQVKAKNSPTKKDMSYAEVDHHMANYRLDDDGEWVKRIKAESPTQLMREQTLMMAQALHQREENTQLLERILTTLTIVAAENKGHYKAELFPKSGI